MWPIRSKQSFAGFCERRGLSVQGAVTKKVRRPGTSRTTPSSTSRRSTAPGRARFRVPGQLRLFQTEGTRHDTWLHRRHQSAAGSDGDRVGSSDAGYAPAGDRRRTDAHSADAAVRWRTRVRASHGDPAWAPAASRAGTAAGCVHRKAGGRFLPSDWRRAGLKRILFKSAAAPWPRSWFTWTGRVDSRHRDRPPLSPKARPSIPAVRFHVRQGYPRCHEIRLAPSLRTAA